MVSESHMRKDIRTGRHNSGLNHSAHLRKHPGHVQQIAAKQRLGGGFGLNSNLAGIGGGGFNIAASAQLRGNGRPSCMGCNCCG